MHHRRSALTVAAFCAALACPLAARAEADTDDLEALLNQPVYAASKFAQDAADAPAAVTVLTAGDIRAYGWRTLADILNAVRGVYLRNDRQYTFVGVRGFGRPGDFSSRLLLLIDGQRINDNIYDQAVAGREFPLDVAMIERVEFLPGPGSALYGSNAVLGTVNVITRSAATLAGGRASVELGSARSRLLQVSLGRELAGGSLLLSAASERRPGADLYFPEYDTPAMNNGMAIGMDGERADKLYAKYRVAELTVTGLVSNRRKTVPNAQYETVFNDPSLCSNDAYAVLGLSWQSDPRAVHSFYVNAGLSAYNYHDGGRYASDGVLWASSSTGRWASLEARWTGRLAANHVLVAGLELQRNLRQDQDYTLLEPVVSTETDVRGSSHRAGVFLSDEWTLPAGWRLNLGLRADRLLDGDSAVTPRLTALWSPASGLTLKALAGRAYREPTAFESQYVDAVSLANPALDSERLASRELAFDWRVASNWRVAGSAYRYTVNGLIDQVVYQAANPADPDNGKLIYENVGTARARGVELEVDHVAAAGWRVRGSWTAQRTEDGNGQRLSNSPRSLLKLHAVTPLPGTAARLGLEMQHIGERLTLAGQTLPAFTLAHLTLQVNPVAAWSLSASIYNLANRRYADPAGPEHVMDTMAQDGRTWRVQLGLQF